MSNSWTIANLLSKLGRKKHQNKSRILEDYGYIPKMLGGLIEMMILDVTRLVRRRSLKNLTLTGIDRVTMAYVRHYHDQAFALVRWAGRSWILSKQQSRRLFDWLENPGSRFKLKWTILLGLCSLSLKTLKSPLYLINTGHIGLGQSDYLRIRRHHQAKLVFFIHDMIPILYPEYFDPGEDARYSQKMNYVLSIADGVITNSQATLDAFFEYAKKSNHSDLSNQVALLAPGILPREPQPKPINKAYFVILSTIEPRKNHAFLLQLWRDLVQRFGQNAPHLVVIGQRGWQCENALDLLDRSPWLREHVTALHDCKDDTLVTYLHHSQALLMPSFIEGYGLPIIEALTLTVPVIASDIPVFREIGGGVVDYADPLDGKRWAELIMDYASPESAKRKAQKKRIETFKSPTWVEHFEKVDAWLKTL